MTDMDTRIKQLEAKVAAYEVFMGRLEHLVRDIQESIDKAVLCLCEKGGPDKEKCCAAD